MSSNSTTLLVYPTAVALRQAQRRALERDAFFDGRGHITLSSLLRECAGVALKIQKLRPISDLDRELAVVDAVGIFRETRPSPLPSPLKGEGMNYLSPGVYYPWALGLELDGVLHVRAKAHGCLFRLVKKGNPSLRERSTVLVSHHWLCVIVRL